MNFFANRRDSNQFSSTKNRCQPSIMFYTLSSVRPKLSTMKKNVLHQRAGTRSIRSASSEYHFIHARTERHRSRVTAKPNAQKQQQQLLHSKLFRNDSLCTIYFPVLPARNSLQPLHSTHAIFPFYNVLIRFCVLNVI